MAVQLILKNSSVADRRPTANQLGNGEISLNFNAAGAFLSCRDTNGDIQQVGGIKVSETAPAAPARQTAWVKPSTHTLSIYSGSSWIDIGAVTSVNGQSGVVTLTKANIGLGNVDNTSDLNKPISTATQNALNAKADLVGGKVPTSQLPSLAVSEYLGPAANQAAMLLLSGERGDWCIRTDLSSTFVLISDGGSSIGDWQELATPASPVSSVNGYTGAVVLGAADVGAATASQGVLADSALQPGDNISELTNDENYITSAEAPVQSVNTQTGAVVLGAADVGAVNLTGDNMTGDLTLGTSNIVLNASNGSAEFGSIDVDNLTLDASTLSSSGTLNIEAGGTGAVAFQTKDTNGNYTFKTTDGSFNGRLQFNDITAQRTYKYPNQDGTVVVKDSTTGALTIDNLTLDGSTVSSSGALNMEAGGSAAINFKSSANNNDYRFYNTAETFYGSLRFNTLTSNRTFNFPDNGGTVALTSDSAWVSGSTSTAGILTLASDLTATFNGDVEIGSNLTINQGNGSIITSGNVQAGGNPASGTADGCRLDGSGTIRAAKTTGGNAIWTGYQVGTTGATSRINADGSASFSGTVTATVVPPSDARFKENITPAKPQLADVVALGKLLKNYDWNDLAPVNDELRSQRQLGLLAHEAAEVCPSITKPIPSISEDSDETYLGISQSALIMKLIGAVAELKAEVDALSELVVVGSDYIAS